MNAKKFKFKIMIVNNNIIVARIIINVCAVSTAGFNVRYFSNCTNKNECCSN